MPQLHASSQVQATAQTIFDFLSEYRNIPRIQPHFESARLVGEKVAGVGATVELKGHFHGVPLSALDKIVTYTPPYRIVTITDGTVLSRNTWELRPVEGSQGTATQVSLTVDYKIRGPLGKLFTGMASSLFNREIEAMTVDSLNRMREIFATKS